MAELIKVYNVSCRYTCLSGMQTDSIDQVIKIIHDDIATLPEFEVGECVYKIKVELMTQQQYDELPEYEP